jgi:excisionase family DNA binding protein
MRGPARTSASGTSSTPCGSICATALASAGRRLTTAPARSPQPPLVTLAAEAGRLCTTTRGRTRADSDVRQQVDQQFISIADGVTFDLVPSLDLVKTAEHQEEPVRDQTERLLTLEESAELLGTGVRFARRLIAERRIQFVKVGRHVRIPQRALRDYIDAATVHPTRAPR